MYKCVYSQVASMLIESVFKLAIHLFTEVTLDNHEALNLLITIFVAGWYTLSRLSALKYIQSQRMVASYPTIWTSALILIAECTLWLIERYLNVLSMHVVTYHWLLEGIILPSSSSSQVTCNGSSQTYSPKRIMFVFSVIQVSVKYDFYTLQSTLC